MPWTTEDKVRALMRLPWRVSARPGDEPNEIVLTLPELPGVIAIGSREDPIGLDRDFWSSLRATLEAYLEAGGPVPLPVGTSYPWERELDRPHRPMKLSIDAGELRMAEGPSTSLAETIGESSIAHKVA